MSAGRTDAAAPSDEERARRRANARRGAARQYAVQALYQCQYGDFSVEELAAQYADQADFPKADADYFVRLIRSAVTDPTGTDDCYAPFLGERTVTELDPICRALMRMATTELLECPEVPTPVIMAEAVRLAGRFGDERLRRFVNGALAETQSQLRPEPPAR